MSGSWWQGWGQGWGWGSAWSQSADEEAAEAQAHGRGSASAGGRWPVPPSEGDAGSPSTEPVRLRERRERTPPPRRDGLPRLPRAENIRDPGQLRIRTLERDEPCLVNAGMVRSTVMSACASVVLAGSPACCDLQHS